MDTKLFEKSTSWKVRITAPLTNLPGEGKIDTYFGSQKIKFNNKSKECLCCRELLKKNDNVIKYGIEEIKFDGNSILCNESYFHFDCFLELFIEAFTDENEFKDYFKGFTKGFRLGREHKGRGIRNKELKNHGIV